MISISLFDTWDLEKKKKNQLFYDFLVSAFEVSLDIIRFNKQFSIKKQMLVFEYPKENNNN